MKLRAERVRARSAAFAATAWGLPTTRRSSGEGSAPSGGATSSSWTAGGAGPSSSGAISVDVSPVRSDWAHRMHGRQPPPGPSDAREGRRGAAAAATGAVDAREGRRGCGVGRVTPTASPSFVLGGLRPPSPPGTSDGSALRSVRDYSAVWLPAGGGGLPAREGGGPGEERGRDARLRGPGGRRRGAGGGLPRARPHRLHLRGPVLQPDDAGGGRGARARAGPARDGRPAHRPGARPAGAAGRPALQRGGGRPVGPHPGRRAEDLPPRLQGVLRGALVLLRARGARGRGAPRRPGGSLRHRHPVPAAGGPRRDARGRDLRGPLGADPPELAPRGRGRHRPAEPLGLERPRGQGRVPPRAGAPAVGPDALRLRLRQRRRPRVHDRPRLRGPPPGRRERRPPGRGRTLPPRRRAPGDRRGRGAAAGRARAPDLLRRRRPHGRPGLPDGRARPGARTAAPPPREDRSTRTRSSPPTRRRSTSGAARSSRSRPPASPAASSTWG